MVVAVSMKLSGGFFIEILLSGQSERRTNCMKEKEAKKKLEEMNLLDDLLFGLLVTYPEIGERFVRKVLRIIFGREFKRLSVTAQKVFYGADSDLHGARLDVYMEPEIEEGFEGRAAVRERV